MLQRADLPDSKCQCTCINHLLISLVCQIHAGTREERDTIHRLIVRGYPGRHQPYDLSQVVSGNISTSFLRQVPSCPKLKLDLHRFSIIHRHILTSTSSSAIIQFQSSESPAAIGDGNATSGGISQPPKLPLIFGRRAQYSHQSFER